MHCLQASTAHEKDLAGLWEQLAKKEEEVTALKEKHKKSYNNTESVVQEWYVQIYLSFHPLNARFD